MFILRHCVMHMVQFLISGSCYCFGNNPNYVCLLPLLFFFLSPVGQVLGDGDERNDPCPKGGPAGGLIPPAPWAHSLNFRLKKMTPLVWECSARRKNKPWRGLSCSYRIFCCDLVTGPFSRKNSELNPETWAQRSSRLCPKCPLRAWVSSARWVRGRFSHSDTRPHNQSKSSDFSTPSRNLRTSLSQRKP